MRFRDGELSHLEPCLLRCGSHPKPSGAVGWILGDTMFVLAAVTSSMALELDLALVSLCPLRPSRGRAEFPGSSPLARVPQCGSLARGQFTAQARTGYGDTVEPDLTKPAVMTTGMIIYVLKHLGREEKLRKGG